MLYNLLLMEAWVTDAYQKQLNEQALKEKKEKKEQQKKQPK